MIHCPGQSYFVVILSQLSLLMSILVLFETALMNWAKYSINWDAADVSTSYSSLLQGILARWTTHLFVLRHLGAGSRSNSLHLSILFSTGRRSRSGSWPLFTPFALPDGCSHEAPPLILSHKINQLYQGTKVAGWKQLKECRWGAGGNEVLQSRVQSRSMHFRNCPVIAAYVR